MDGPSAPEGKSPLASRTIGFNVASGMLVPAIWPFLPKHFREQEYSIAAVTAWFAIANIAIRFMTTETLILWSKRAKK